MLSFLIFYRPTLIAAEGFQRHHAASQLDAEVASRRHLVK
jgi:hypothetical protein